MADHEHGRLASSGRAASAVGAQAFVQTMAGAQSEVFRAAEAAGLAPETGDLIGLVCRYVTRRGERALFAPDAVAAAELDLDLGRIQDAVRACERHYDCAAQVRALGERLDQHIDQRIDDRFDHLANHLADLIVAGRRENATDNDNNNGRDGDDEGCSQVDGDEEKHELYEQLRTAAGLLSSKDAEIARLRAELTKAMDSTHANKRPGNSPATLEAVFSSGASWPSYSPPSLGSRTPSETGGDDDDDDDEAYDDSQARLLEQAHQHVAAAEAAAREHEEALHETRREAAEQARLAAERAEQQRAAAEERVRAECAAAAAAEQQTAAAELAATRDQLGQSLEANGRLFTSLCDLQPNIRVMARVRPPPAGTPPDALDALPTRAGATSNGLQRVGVPEKASVMAGVRGDGPSFEHFDFERVFDGGAANAAVVAAVEPLVGHALGGRHVCVFAYGQTGTGKSHTMGAADGVIPSAFAMLDGWIAARRGTRAYTVEATFVEIYAENCYDLLRDGDVAEKVAVRFDSRRNPATGKVEKFYFAESRRVELTRDGVLDHERVNWTLDRAARNRRVRATQKNSESSRSHSLLALHIRGAAAATGEATEGVLNLIDLAGSERFHVAGAASAEAQAEAIAINKSLSALQKVLADMANPRATRTSLRESTLTKLLEPCLGDDAKCLMLVMVSPLRKDREETRNTLRFGKGAQQVKLRTIKSTAEFGSASASAQPSPAKTPPTVARPGASTRKPAAASSSSTATSHRTTPTTKEFSQRSFRERVVNGQGPGRSNAQRHGL